ncbi:MAG: metalloregulator ArsR/SmtB family transcription factor [Candidatus Nanohaloarchaeota archaeon QJJ-7]|nr:metalloregulator ArsR/SmtB family transcription factor [Candidatus Nanohaloarchaeota archaeon QJJ-7]
MKVFRALSDETRREMVRSLMEREEETCVCEFEEFIDRDASVIYRNVKKLEDAGIVSTEKKGRELLVSVEDEDTVRELLEAARSLEPGEDR